MLDYTLCIITRNHVLDGCCKLLLAGSWLQLPQVLGVVCTDGQVSPQGASEEQVQVEGRRILSFGSVAGWQAHQARHVCAVGCNCCMIAAIRVLHKRACVTDAGTHVNFLYAQ